MATKAEILARFPDNIAGQITPEDFRALVEWAGGLLDSLLPPSPYLVLSPIPGSTYAAVSPLSNQTFGEDYNYYRFVQDDATQPVGGGTNAEVPSSIDLGDGDLHTERLWVSMDDSAYTQVPNQPGYDDGSGGYLIQATVNSEYAIGVKDPDDIGVLSVDLSGALANIGRATAIDWQLPAGLTQVASYLAGSKAVLLYSGGTAGTYYTISPIVTYDHLYSGETDLTLPAIDIPILCQQISGLDASNAVAISSVYRYST